MEVMIIARSYYVGLVYCKSVDIFYPSNSVVPMTLTLVLPELHPMRLSQLHTLANITHATTRSYSSYLFTDHAWYT